MRTLSQITMEDILTDALEEITGGGGRSAQAQAINNDMQQLLEELSAK